MAKRLIRTAWQTKNTVTIRTGAGICRLLGDTVRQMDKSTHLGQRYHVVQVTQYCQYRKVLEIGGEPAGNRRCRQTQLINCQHRSWFFFFSATALNGLLSLSSSGREKRGLSTKTEVLPIKWLCRISGVTYFLINPFLLILKPDSTAFYFRYVVPLPLWWSKEVSYLLSDKWIHGCGLLSHIWSFAKQVSIVSQCNCV